MSIFGKQPDTLTLDNYTVILPSDPPKTGNLMYIASIDETNHIIYYNWSEKLTTSESLFSNVRVNQKLFFGNIDNIDDYIQSNDTNLTIKSGGILKLDGTTSVNISVNGSDELVITGASTTFSNNIVIPDAGTIGSTSYTDAMSISSMGVVNISAITESTDASTGALTVEGGVGIANDLYVGTVFNVNTAGDTYTKSLNNNNGGITKVGSISGATTIDGTGALKLTSGTGGIIMSTTDTSTGIRIGNSSGVPILIGDETSTVTVSKHLIIGGDLTVNGMTTTVNTETLVVKDKNIDLGNYTIINDSNANGGGITLKGNTDKTLNWDTTNQNWTSSEHFNVAVNKEFKINNEKFADSSALYSTNLQIKNIKAKDGTSVGSIADGTGIITLVNSILTTTEIKGGTIDNTIIGGTTAVAGTFTSLNTISLTIGETLINTTPVELNLISGNTTPGTVGVEAGDGILINNSGTMKMTSVETVSTYFSSESVGGGNIVTTGALNAGSITSGFGPIDNGSSGITSSGTASFNGTTIITNADIKGGTIDDTVIGGTTAVAGSFTSLTTTNLTTTSLTTTSLTIGGTSVSSSADELNILTDKKWYHEDNMVSNDANGIASQQSIKAYVTAAVNITEGVITNNDYPIIFHDGSNFNSDELNLHYNPSSNTLKVDHIVVNGTHTTVDTVTMHAENAIKFQGVTANQFYTTLTIIDPTKANIINLPNNNGTIALFTTPTNTSIDTIPAELNLISGGTSRGITPVGAGDGILINNAGTMRMTNVDTVSTYFSSHSVGGGNIVTTGALDAGSITSGFGAIDNGDSGITTSNADINGGTIDNTVIGATTAAAGSFTTISGSSNFTVGETNFTVDATNGNTVILGTLTGLTSIDTGDSTTPSIISTITFTNGAIQTLPTTTHTRLGYGAGNPTNTAQRTLHNTSVGLNAGAALTTGDNSCFFGYQSGLATTTGSDNCFIGKASGRTNSSGSSNCFIGKYAGYTNATGSSNCFIGQNAGYTNTTGASNIAIGFNAGPTVTGESNKLFIDSATLAKGNLSLIYGDFVVNPFVTVNGDLNVTGTVTGPTAVEGTNSTQLATTAFVTTALDSKAGLGAKNAFTDTTNSTSLTTGAMTIAGGVGIKRDLLVGGNVTAYYTSDKRLKTNITKIENPLVKLDKINGYTFDWIPTKDVHSNVGRDIGVIAQEIEEVLPEITVTRDNGYKAVKYEKIVPLLIECIKEQQKQIDELRRCIELK